MSERRHLRRPQSASPYNITCTDAKAGKGTPRWNNDKEWVYQFDNDLPPGVSCTLSPPRGFKSPKGPPLPAAHHYTFSTGGPFVQQVRPGTWQRIDEEQAFILQLNGPASPASLQAGLWCAVEGLGERVPVRLLEGQDRAALLEAYRVSKAAAANPLNYVAMACNRRLPANARVQLVYGKGIATPSGVASTSEQRFTFQVREPFAASFTCERENAQAACLPIRPLHLTFNAPVPRQLARADQLTAARARQPHAHGRGGGPSADALVNSVSFKVPLPEQASFTLELPRDFKTPSGRALRNADNFPLKVATGPLPPLAKFAAAPFGIVERFAEPDGQTLLPVTLRHVEPDLKAQTLAPARVGDLQPKTDAEIIALVCARCSATTAGRSARDQAADVSGQLPRVLEAADKDWVQPRMVSLLAGPADVKTLDLPKPASNDPRPFEVVGIPLAPGFHVVEIASPLLGASLLDARHGAARTMYVRTSALVTNLGVHFKLGRENALAWVTTLDKGQSVEGARVRVSDCNGKQAGARHDRRTGHRPIQWPVARGAGLHWRRRQRRRRTAGLLCERPRARCPGRRGHDLRLERLEPRHRGLALQPPHLQRSAGRRARPHRV